MSNIENMANEIIPIMTKCIITTGIIMSLLGITVALYMLIKRKSKLSETKFYLINVCGGGVLISISGILVNFIFHFDIDYGSYKISIPLGYFVSIVIFVLLKNVISKTNGDIDKS